MTCVFFNLIQFNIVLMFEISIHKKKEGRFCCAYACTNKPVKKKGGLCHKHYARKLRIETPKKVRYSQMKQKAKQRNIPFSLTLEQFFILCRNTGYLSKGKRGQNVTVDRRCNFQGYHFFNLQIISHRANASKGDRHSGSNFSKPEKEKTIEELITNNEGNNEDLPF